MITTAFRRWLQRLHNRLSFSPGPRPPRQRSSPELRHQARPTLEYLEDRTLLSTINWVNEGKGSNDSDCFSSVFQNNVDLARGVVMAVIASWEKVITRFNYSDGTNTFRLTVQATLGNNGLLTDG